MIFRILSLLLASMFFVACGDDDGDRNGAPEDETPRDEGRDNDYASIAAGYCALEYEC